MPFYIIHNNVLINVCLLNFCNTVEQMYVVFVNYPVVFAIFVSEHWFFIVKTLFLYICNADIQKHIVEQTVMS